jgi:hypothetical protein
MIQIYAGEIPASLEDLCAHQLIRAFSNWRWRNDDLVISHTRLLRFATSPDIAANCGCLSERNVRLNASGDSFEFSSPSPRIINANQRIVSLVWSSRSEISKFVIRDQFGIEIVRCVSESTSSRCSGCTRSGNEFQWNAMHERKLSLPVSPS